MLVERKEYLSAGVHIGMKTCTPYLKQFVYKIREDGLIIFNLKKIDERFGIAGRWLSCFQKPLIVARKESAIQPVKKFAEVIGAKAITGRFPPGTLTNPSFNNFFEPDVVFVTDPMLDAQAIKEAKKKHIPILALANSFNEVNDIDLIIPMNNNAKKSIALALWIIAREILKTNKKIKKEAEFTHSIKDFGGE
ncbi:MAG: 30S ribosomal protein S2 [Candidatus Aenigmatarchaeota archaeon]